VKLGYVTLGQVFSGKFTLDQVRTYKVK